MSDEQAPPEVPPGPRPLRRGQLGAVLPRRGDTAPKYRGRVGGSVGPPRLTKQRTSSMAPLVPAARPDAQPQSSTFRPHPNAPSMEPQYVGSVPTVQAAQAAGAAQLANAPPPEPPQPPPPAGPAVAPQGTAVQHRRNVPQYVTKRADTTPQYVGPSARAHQAAHAAAEPQPGQAGAPPPDDRTPQYVQPPPGGGGARGLDVAVNYVPPRLPPSQDASSAPPSTASTSAAPPPSQDASSAPPSAPASPMTRLMTAEELQAAADGGDQQAAALLRQLGDVENEDTQPTGREDEE